jgi:hypothetical protein
MNSSLGKDIRAEVYPAAALDPVSATAGGAGDGTEVDGLTIDQQSLPTKFNSVDFEIVAKAVLAEDKTLSVTGNLQDSADGSAWTDITTPATLLTLTGGSGGSTERGVARMGVDLTKYRRYVRCQVTPELSATATDTANLQGIAVFGGGQVLPQ